MFLNSYHALYKSYLLILLLFQKRTLEGTFKFFRIFLSHPYFKTYLLITLSSDGGLGAGTSTYTVCGSTIVGGALSSVSSTVAPSGGDLLPCLDLLRNFTFCEPKLNVQALNFLQMLVDRCCLLVSIIVQFCPELTD